MVNVDAEVLRRAANLLAGVADRDDRKAQCAIADAADVFGAAYPPAPDGTLLPVEEALHHVANLDHWEDRHLIPGLRWIAQAAQLRLLVEEIMARSITGEPIQDLGRMALTWYKETRHG